MNMQDSIEMSNNNTNNNNDNNTNHYQSLSSNGRVYSEDLIAFHKNEPVLQLDVEAVLDEFRSNNKKLFGKKTKTCRPPVKIEDHTFSKRTTMKTTISEKRNMYEDFDNTELEAGNNSRLSTFDRNYKDLNLDFSLDGTTRISTYENLYSNFTSEFPLGEDLRLTSGDFSLVGCDDGRKEQEQEHPQERPQEKDDMQVEKPGSSFDNGGDGVVVSLPPLSSCASLVPLVPPISDDHHNNIDEERRVVCSTPPPPSQTRQTSISRPVTPPLSPISPRIPMKTKTATTTISKKKGDKKKAISSYTDDDVLFGRGGLSNHHSGNIRYRAEADRMKEFYCRPGTSKAQKTAMSHELVKYIKKNGGRFLKFNGSNKEWTEVDDKIARRKASQALREDKKSSSN